MSFGTQQAAYHGHKESGWYALIRNIADRNSEQAFSQLNEIKEVATHGPGRDHACTRKPAFRDLHLSMPFDNYRNVCE